MSRPSTPTARIAFRNNNERIETMTFGEAVKKAMEQGGGLVKDYARNEYKVMKDGEAFPGTYSRNFCGNDWYIEPFVQPQPAPEPELMTMAQAITKAVEIGGGEVWKEGATEHELSVTSSLDIDFYQEQYHTSDGKSYTVRPLPDPYPLDFAEAWEALGRGENVIMQDFVCEESGTNEVSVVIEPYVKCKAANSGAYVSINRMRDSKFRIVEEKSKA